ICGNARRLTRRYRVSVLTSSRPALGSQCSQSEFIEPQAHQVLNLTSAGDVSRHSFSDRIVDVDFSIETVGLKGDGRQYLDHGFAVSAGHTEDQFRLFS